MAYGQTEKLNSIGHQYKLILFLFLSGLAEGKHLISLTRGAVYKVSPLQATSINVLQDIEQREQKDVAEKLGVLEKELKVGEGKLVGLLDDIILHQIQANNLIYGSLTVNLSLT